MANKLKELKDKLIYGNRAPKAADDGIAEENAAAEEAAPIEEPEMTEDIPVEEAEPEMPVEETEPDIPAVEETEPFAAETEKSEESKTPKKEKKPFLARKPKSEKQPRKGLPKRNNRKQFKDLKTWQKVLAICGGIVLFGLLVLFVMYEVNREDISDYTYIHKDKTQIISADDVVIAELFTENRTYITLDQVPENARNALIAVEDSRFRSHHGVDYIGVIRSIFANLDAGRATSQGASTITQQLARTLFLPPINTETSLISSLNRKFKEISIALQLESKYSKDEILEMFFNETYFGSGAYGIEEAAKTYFGKSASECDLAECAMLAGLPQAPSAYAPNDDFEAAKARQQQVLQRMVVEGYIDQATADAAYAEELSIQDWNPEVLDHQVSDGYGAFVNRVLQQYAEAQAPGVMKEQNISEEEAIGYIRDTIAGGGYKVYTTIDSCFQEAALNAVNGRMSAFDSSYTAALTCVALDGAVKAYYGGNTDIDMANSPRQPGSGIKPLYYSCAFENGIATPDTTVVDEPTDFGGYAPQNSGGGFSGTMSFRQALIQSKNIPSVKLFEMTGADLAVPWMKNLGITTFADDDIYLAVALGGMAHGIKPCEMAAAYNVMNNSGIYNQPYYVTEVQKNDGTKVFDKSGLKLDSHRGMAEETAATMWDILRQVVTGGTGTAAYCGLPTAGKTGTTDEEHDLWFNGMTSDYTTSVWLGSPENNRIGSSSGYSAGLYGDFMRTLVDNGVVTE